MKTNNRTLLKKEINQMNMNFVIQLAVINPSITVIERLKVVERQVNEHLQQIDQLFSAFRYDSLVSQFQRGDQKPLTSSDDFKSVYNSAILSQQMTNGIYRPYFAGRFDPSEIVSNWAIEQVFNDELKPLMKMPEVIGIYLNGAGNSKFATKQGADFRWKIDIADVQDTTKTVTTYYLQNGAVATHKHTNKNGKTIQATIIRSSLIEAGVWSFVGSHITSEEFVPFITHYNLTGILTIQDKNPINFNLGTVISKKDSRKIQSQD